MKRAILPGLTFLLGLAGGSVQSQTVPAHADALYWLQHMASAAQKLSYSGTFVYRSGNRSETSRIVHMVSDGNRMEKLEVLDGSPREVIRHNDEVRCYLPDSRMVIVEQRSVRRSFPALFPVSLAGLGEHYLIRKGAMARIAGFDSQIVRLEPRDPWRYGHQLWIEPVSGLLLKADILDARGESLESMVFTDLHIGGTIAPDVLKPTYAEAARNAWQLRRARLQDMRDDAGWQFHHELPGFRKQVALRRSMTPAGDDFDMLHWVFSDGLVAMSVFISPLRPQDNGGEETMQSLGALSVVKRIIDGHQVVVMGDLPLAATKLFADGIGVRKP